MSKRKRDKMKRKELRHQVRDASSEVKNKILKVKSARPSSSRTPDSIANSSSGLAVDELSHLRTMSPEWRKLYETISIKTRI